jgi:hypothetical protein
MAQPQEFRLGDIVIIVGGALQDRRGMVTSRLNGHKYRLHIGSLAVEARAKHLRPLIESNQNSMVRRDILDTA